MDPGEYEVGGIFLWGVPLQSKGQPPVTAFVCEVDGIFVCHLGLLRAAPASAQIEELGPIDILLLPVGGPDYLSPAAAADLVGQIEPQVVIPMYYPPPGVPEERFFPLERLARELGLKAGDPQPSYHTRGRGSGEQTSVVVLECKAQVSAEVAGR